MSADDITAIRSSATGAATGAATRQGPLLEAVDVTKHYRVKVGRLGRGIVHAAENISVALYPGAVTAIVGESGSGKSTLSRLLARTQKLTSGKLYFHGEEVDLHKRVSADYRRS